MEKGLRFTLRDHGSTLGYGVATEMLPDFDVDAFDLQRKRERKARLKAEQQAGGQ